MQNKIESGLSLRVVGVLISMITGLSQFSVRLPVFEAVIHNCLCAQVSSQLSDAQYGFRAGRVTTGHLLHLMTCLIPADYAGLHVDVAYLDFRKAQD